MLIKTIWIAETLQIDLEPLMMAARSASADPPPIIIQKMGFIIPESQAW